MAGLAKGRCALLNGATLIWLGQSHDSLSYACFDIFLPNNKCAPPFAKRMLLLLLPGLYLQQVFHRILDLKRGWIFILALFLF
jgi:hypothetical protein